MKARAISLFLLVFSSVVSASSQPSQEVIGKAYDLDSGDLLYVERHRYLANKTHEVRYFDPDGKPFARKVLDYSVSENAPSFEQRNDLRGEWIKVTDDGDELLLKYQEKTGETVFDKRFDLSDDLLVDAGFDRYVKNNWQALNAGSSDMSIEYLVPSKLTTVGFNVSKVDCLPETPKGAVCFAIAPQSWWISLAVDPIIVAYDVSSRNLLRFNGRGNIASAQGKYQSVDIRYEYPEKLAHN